ncbi:hypothetical protein LVY72_18610 [Arthrobacter sp. I2-34]|uniref:Uncharacterized protein n=1 Tax=Arthrobacter hankyongi TaxID=2904801 RepID=A0ABS9LB74_9MICC|nr:hypothetical protein [Arthrobacter hankyongi]MCG2623910.1 hypothetical protein [Arthrobacter hankyongi]
MGLFKKTGHSSSASMPWQLLSATRTDSCSALEDGLLQCIHLLHRGAGLTVRDILTIQPGPAVEVFRGPQSTAHSVYVVETDHRRLALGPGFSMHRWVKLPKIGRFDGRVDWLDPILDAVASSSLRPLQKVTRAGMPGSSKVQPALAGDEQAAA